MGLPIADRETGNEAQICRRHVYRHTVFLATFIASKSGGAFTSHLWLHSVLVKLVSFPHPLSPPLPPPAGASAVAAPGALLPCKETVRVAKGETHPPATF